jgi:hypothetical protein
MHCVPAATAVPILMPGTLRVAATRASLYEALTGVNLRRRTALSLRRKSSPRPLPTRAEKKVGQRQTRRERQEGKAHP